MALAVATTSTATANNSGSVVVTKPTGVQVGDLLVILAVAEHDGNNGFGNATITCTGFTEGAQAARENNNVITDANVQGILLYKIADSGDVSASNYTVNFNTGSSEAGGIVAMLRITGWTTGNPVFSRHESNSSLAPTSISVIRPVEQLLIMLVARKEDNEGWSFGSYSVTSTDSNPTWTEVVDAVVTVNATPDSRRISAAVAYASTTNTSTITGYSATATDLNVGSNTVSYDISFLAVLCEPTNVTADVSHLAVTPTIVGVTVSQVNVAPTVGHLAVTPTINGVSGRAEQNQWTNPNKPSTTWTNIDKP